MTGKEARRIISVCRTLSIDAEGMGNSEDWQVRVAFGSWQGDYQKALADVRLAAYTIEADQ
jgi:hypothetical protein